MLCTNPPVILASVCVACKSVITVCASCRANSDFYDIALFIQIFIYLPYPPPPPPPHRPSRQLIWSFKVEENKTVWRRVGARKSRTAVTGTGTLLNYEKQVSAFKIQTQNRAEGRAGPGRAAACNSGALSAVRTTAKTRK